MGRRFVSSTFALALALSPAVLFAQATPPAQPPAGQAPAQPAGQAAAPAQPAAPKVAFTTPAGVLLVQIKPDKTADFEELVTKLKAGIGKTTDETIKKQGAGLKVFKATEPFNNNTLYLVMFDPAVPASEYDMFTMLSKTMTPEEQRAPEVAAMWKRFADAFGAGLGKLSLTPVGQ
jgi:hypothetical protein